jgi:hypothetical protein
MDGWTEGGMKEGREGVMEGGRDGGKISPSADGLGDDACERELNSRDDGHVGCARHHATVQHSRVDREWQVLLRCILAVQHGL